ncbi:hypothetical protein EYF80_023530 [Liparis tanakae]|uniref:Uncharacterized protein n=1 Tax=Liparis tanakae TaxID=230148 RepID=A0A4Z2HKK1_9TELE|nr:hypothetical protein EYF80_023530 [Liparis tanakae]
MYKADCTWLAADVVPRLDRRGAQPGHSLRLTGPNTPDGLSKDTESPLILMSWMHPTKDDVTGSACCIAISAAEKGARGRADLLLFAHRQSDAALGYVQRQMRAPSSGRHEEQEAFRSSGPDIQGEHQLRKSVGSTHIQQDASRSVEVAEVLRPVQVV